MHIRIYSSPLMRQNFYSKSNILISVLWFIIFILYCSLFSIFQYVQGTASLKVIFFCHIFFIFAIDVPELQNNLLLQVWCMAKHRPQKCINSFVSEIYMLNFTCFIYFERNFKDQLHSLCEYCYIGNRTRIFSSKGIVKVIELK